MDYQQLFFGLGCLIAIGIALYIFVRKQQDEDGKLAAQHERRAPASTYSSSRSSGSRRVSHVTSSSASSGPSRSRDSDDDWVPAVAALSTLDFTPTETYSCPVSVSVSDSCSVSDSGCCGGD